MRKRNIIKASLLFLFIFSFSFVFHGVTSAKTKPIVIFIDEVKAAYTSQQSQIIDGIAMVSSIPVVKQMDAKYEWNAKKKQLTIIKDNKKLQLTIGNKKALLNNKQVLLDAKPQLVQGNVYIPVKSVFLAFDGEVKVLNYLDDIRMVVAITDHGKMLRAIEDNNYNKVKNFINNGIEIDKTDNTGGNYLHRAINNSSTEITQLLIDNNVSTNQKDDYDATPLFKAIMLCEEGHVKALLPYTDLSFNHPVFKVSYLEYAKKRLESYKKDNDEKINSAEAIVTYVEDAMAGQSLITSPKYATAMGETAKITVTSKYNDKKLMGITVDKVLRGKHAWKKIAEADFTNKPPTEGKEYIAILIRTNLKIDSNYDLPDKQNFNLFDIKGSKYYGSVFITEPYPHFDTNYYSGNNENASGWLVYSVPENFPLDQLILGYEIENNKSFTYFKLEETKEEEEYSVDLSQLSLPSSISSMPNETELKSILQQNFSRLSGTSQGDIPFKFKIFKNESRYTAFDFDISTVMDFSMYYDIVYSNKITKEKREIIIQQLKDHQERIGQTLVALYPNIKFTGSYSDSWYKYPILRIGMQSYSLNKWSNYDYTFSYEEAKPSFFRWGGR